MQEVKIYVNGKLCFTQKASFEKRATDTLGLLVTSALAFKTQVDSSACVACFPYKTDWSLRP